MDDLGFEHQNLQLYMTKEYLKKAISLVSKSISEVHHLIGASSFANQQG